MEQLDFNNIRLEDILYRSGYEPSYIKGGSAWYISPFREEKKPSFQVRGGVFMDWGDPSIKGGILDLCSRLWDIPRDNVKEIFARLKEFDSCVPLLPRGKTPIVDEESQKKEKIIAEYPLDNPILIDYLRSRGVDPFIAQAYTKVLVYMNPTRTKKLFGIGFPNRQGGYELRSKFAKRSFAPKDISILPSSQQGSDKGYAVVFEGFIDCLSYLSQKHRNQESINFDCVVLNGVGQIHQAIDELKDYELVYGLLDNDKAGDNATLQLSSELSNFVDRREWLGTNKDVNEKIMSLFLSEVKESSLSFSQKKAGRNI